MKDRLTYTAHTCKAYSDLWSHHYRFLEENWPGREIPALLVTDETDDQTFPNMPILAAGKGLEMPQRIQDMLSQIQTEYILLTLDDYFPIYPVENERLQRLLDIMDRERIDYMRLFNDPPAKRKWEGYDNIFHIDLDRDYDVNLYQGIWRKSFLEKTVGQSLSAWQYEVTLTRIAKSTEAVCAVSKGDEFRILDVIRKGKLLHKADRYLKKQGVTLPNRELISRWEELRIWVFNHGKRVLSAGAAKKVKKLLNKFGYRFYSDSI